MTELTIPKKRVLVTPPTFFEPPTFEKCQNRFEIEGRRLFERDPDAFRAGAQEEFEQIVSTLQATGLAEVVEVPADAKSPDGIFARDGSINQVLTDGKTRVPVSVLANFSNINRQYEADQHRLALEGLNEEDRIIVQSPFALEGGDVEYDSTRGVFWAGFYPNASTNTAHAGRTSLLAHSFMRQAFGRPVIPLQTWEPRYHLDTFLGIGPDGALVSCFDGMPEETQRAILYYGFELPKIDPDKYLIRVSAAEADRLGTNFLKIGRTVLIPEGNSRIERELRPHCDEVIPLKLKFLGAGGGSSHCATNVIDDEVHINGGWPNFDQLRNPLPA